MSRAMWTSTRAMWARTLAVCVCVGALAGCGGAATGSGALPGGGEVSDPPADLAGLRRDLEATVLENYALLELGNIDAFADRVASDRAIAIFGVEPDDVVAGVSPASLWEDRRLFRGRRLRMLSRNLDIHVSRDRSVGWVFDEMSYRVPHRGREASIPLRVTSLYTRDVDRWVLAMQHTSYPRSNGDIERAARAGEQSELGRFQTGYSVDGPATALRRIVWRVSSGAIGPHYRERRMADSADALVLLPGPRQEYLGASVRHAPTLAALFGADGAEATVEIGDHRIEVARNGEVAWMAANLGARVPGGDEDAGTVKLRGTFVLEDRPGRGWVVVQSHVSAATSQDVIAERIFGVRELD